MPFSDAQQEMYQVSLDFITAKLDRVMDSSKNHQSALDAACFLLYVTLNYPRPEVEKIALMLYPEKTYQRIRNVFLELHDLLHNKNPNHSFIKSISDARFFSSTDNSKYIKEHLDLFANSLKQDLNRWLEQQYKDKVVTPEAILDLEKQHLSRSFTP